MKKAVSWNILVIAYRNHRLVSLTKDGNPIKVAKRDLIAMEHSNNALQNLWIDAEPIKRDHEFTFDLRPASAIRDAAQLEKLQIMDECRKAGLNVLNHR